MNENNDLENPLIEEEKEIMVSEDRSVKSDSMEQSFSSSLNYPIKDSFEIKWVFNQMLNMNFSKKELIAILNETKIFQDNQNLTKEELLNLTIDTFLAAQFEKNIQKEIPSSPFSIRSTPVNSLVINHPKATLPKRKINVTAFSNNKPNKICQICCEGVLDDNIYSIMECKHSFCMDCVFNYLQTLINDGKVLTIKCPSEKCNQNLSEFEIKDIIQNDEELTKKYIKFKRDIEVSMDSKHRWCIRPGCEFLVEGSPNNPKSTCQCGQTMCFKCMYPWHEGICENAIDKEYKKYADKWKVKSCPKCKSRIEKNEGCNHIHCTRCKYDFCWLCNKEYKPGHYEWYNLFGCPMMMYANLNNSKFQNLCFCLKKTAYIIGIILVVLLLIALVAGLTPLALILFAVLTPVFIYIKICEPKKNFKGIMIGILFFLFGLPLAPLILILAFIPGICVILCCRNQIEEIYM